MLALGIGTLGLATGCGFRPIYGPAGSGSALDGKPVVAQGGGPNDFTLARALQDRLGPPDAAPRFRLTTALSISAEEVAVTTAQSTNRFNLIGVVDYTLTDIATGGTVRAGRVDGFNSFSAVGTSLAVRTAQMDATERLMVILADRVMLDLLASPALRGDGGP
jgi:LPS-assembly lipoprotein